MAVAAKQIRYLKLGRGGRWESVSLDQGELHFGYGTVPHKLALAGDREEIRGFQIQQGRSANTASDDAREVSEFYRLGADCLWITIARGFLWWTFAEAEVTWLGRGEGHGVRIRKAIGGWRNTDINGVRLLATSLSTSLTKVASYRRTVCRVNAEDYLLRRINGIVEPLVERGNQAREALIQVVSEAIKTLDWADFETMVDIIFARSGWHRASAIGGTQKIVDLVLEQPTTGERAAVQVKSSANQRILDGFISSADEGGKFQRLFFACHSPRGQLSSPEREDVHIWTGRELAETALRLGLSDWILERISYRLNRVQWMLSYRSPAGAAANITKSLGGLRPVVSTIRDQFGIT
jgi:hypothetical protein